MLHEMMVKAAQARATGAEPAARAAAVAYLDSYASGDIEGRVALFAPDGTFEDPIGTPPIRGREVLRAFWEQGAGLDVVMQLEHLAANGNTAALLFTARIAMPGSPAVQIRVIETVEVDDEGRITRLRAHFDEGAISAAG